MGTVLVLISLVPLQDGPPYRVLNGTIKSLENDVQVPVCLGCCPCYPCS